MTRLRPRSVPTRWTSGWTVGEQLGLEQQLAEAEAVHGVALHHLHDQVGK